MVPEINDRQFHAELGRTPPAAAEDRRLTLQRNRKWFQSRIKVRAASDSGLGRVWICPSTQFDQRSRCGSRVVSHIRRQASRCGTWLAPALPATKRRGESRRFQRSLASAYAAGPGVRLPDSAHRPGPACISPAWEHAGGSWRCWFHKCRCAGRPEALFPWPRSRSGWVKFTSRSNCLLWGLKASLRSVHHGSRFLRICSSGSFVPMPHRESGCARARAAIQGRSGGQSCIRMSTSRTMTHG